MQKTKKQTKNHEKFSGPPFRPQKISAPPPFAMKITGQPQACKLYFYWKICDNFFKPPPLTKFKYFKDPLVAAGSPNKCESSLRTAH